MRVTYTTGTGSQRAAWLIADDASGWPVLDWPFGFQKLTQQFAGYESAGIFLADSQNRAFGLSLQVGHTWDTLANMFKYVRDCKNLPNTGRLELNESGARIVFPEAHLDSFGVSNGVGLTQVLSYRFSAGEITVS